MFVYFAANSGNIRNIGDIFFEIILFFDFLSAIAEKGF